MSVAASTPATTSMPTHDQRAGAEAGAEHLRRGEVGARDAGDGRDRRHGEQAGGPGDRVVDAGRDAGLVGRCRGQHRGGERGDQQGQSDAEDDAAAEDLEEEVRVAVDLQVDERTRAAMMSGPNVIGHRGPMRWPSAPARPENSSMRIVGGIVARPASSGE